MSNDEEKAPESLELDSGYSTEIPAGTPSEAKRDYAALHRIGWAEGISYLVLLFVAMPIKYLAGYPIAVRICGPIHGALFVWLLVKALSALVMGELKAKQVVIIMVASVVPFGPFLIDRVLGEAEAGS